MQASKNKHLLSSILRPRSVVVVGGSEKSATMSGAPIVNLQRHGYGGIVYVVNPNYDHVGPYRSYPEAAQLPQTPDTAIIVVAANRVASALKDCAAAGVRTATIVASGIGESAAGSAGDGRSDELRRVVGETGVRILGPNTTGIINVLDGYVPRASVNHPKDILPGNLAIVGQSGALGNAIFNRALRARLGVAYLVGTGNQIDIDVWDISEEILRDDRVGCLLLVLETVGDPRRIHDVAALARKRNVPIIALKIGTSDVGAQMVNTHSGALAGSAHIVEAVLREEGVLVVDELDDLWEVGQLVQFWGLKQGPVHSLALLSTSGGEAALGADHAVPAGLSLRPPSQSMQSIIMEKFAFASGGNPFDLTAEFLSKPDLVPLAVGTMLAEDYDAVLFASLVIGGPYADSLYGSIEEFVRREPRPRFALSARTGPEGHPPALERLLSAGLPLFEGTERAMRALGYFNTLGALSLLEPPSPPHPAAPRASIQVSTLTYWDSRKMLEAAGMPFNAARMVDSVDEACAAARDLGYPITLKLSLRDSTHKLAAGGVRLMLGSDDAVATNANELLLRLPRGPRLEGEGLVVEKHFAGVAEAFVGAHRDDTSGPLIVFGLGGSLAEQYRDVAYVRAPSDGARIARAIRSTKIGAMLVRHPRSLEALVNILHQLGRWFATREDIVSVDVNPVLITPPAGLVAVDARVAVGRPRPISGEISPDK